MLISIPVYTLLGFATWTLLVLLLGVGIRRWQLILTGRAAINTFPSDIPHGSPGYRRAMRAHANCVENLPVYGAVVLSAALVGLDRPVFDRLAILFLAMRILQSLVHLVLDETPAATALRFGFFLPQLVCVFTMIGVIVTA